MNSSILLSFGLYVLKRLAEKISDAYQSTIGENSLIQHFKTFAKRGALSLATLYCIYTRRIEWLSDVGEL